VKQFKLSFWRKMNVAHHLASAMEYLLKKPCSNPNLCPSNILFTDMWDCKVADQSFCDWKTSMHKKNLLGPTDEPSLIKEYGLLLWELITEQDSAPIRKGGPLHFPERCPTKLKELILSCCDESPPKRPQFAQFTDDKMLDEIFLEALKIGTNVCNDVWKAMGGGTAVQWSKFLPTFCNQLGIQFNERTGQTLEVKCLKHMLDCSPANDEMVALDAFKRLFMCVGPFIDGSEILDQVKALMETEWFVGPLSAAEAEKMLADLPARAFLVRFSSNSGEYSITFKEKKDKTLHSRVPNNAKFNLHDYVKMLQEKKKFQKSPPSPFQHLFTSSDAQSHLWKFIR